MVVLLDRSIDLVQGVIRRGSVETRLTTREVELLAYLANRAGETVTRDALLTEVWGYRPTAETRVVDNMVRKLRMKIEVDPSTPVHLLTVFGTGYRFELAPTADAPGPLVAPSAAIFGREVLVEQLRALVHAERAVCLSGPPGIGKSAVAASFARAVGGRGWCDVAGVTTPAELDVRVCASLGVPAGCLDGALAAGALVVLDACDALSPAAEALVARWVSTFDGLRIVITSRIRRLARVAAVLDVGTLPPGPARAVLDRAAARVRPGRPLLDSEAAALLDRLEGWPLAIELAAARLRVVDAADLVARLDASRLSVLRDPGGESLAAALADAVEALPPPERALLARCSVFAGGFSPSDAELVCDLPDALDGLHRLVDRSLVLPLADGRLVLLEPIREVAAQALDPRDGPGVRRRHLARFAEVARRASTPPVTAHRDRAIREWANLSAALDEGLRADPAAAADIAGFVARELARRGHHRRRLELLDAVLAIRAPWRDAVALRLARLDTRLYLGEGVDEEFQQIAEALAQSPDAELEAELALFAARRALMAGEVDGAERSCRQALDLAAGARTDHPIHSLGRLVLGSILIDRRRWDDAIGPHLDVIARGEAIGDLRLQAVGWTHLGLLETLRRRYDEASAHLARAAALTTSEPWQRLSVDTDRLRLAILRGRADEARALWDALVPELERFGVRERSKHAVLLAHLAIHDGDHALAERELTAFRWFARVHQRSAEPHAAAAFAYLFRVTDRPQAAIDALAAQRGAGPPDVVADANAAFASARAAAGDLAGAEADLAVARADPASHPVAIGIASAWVAWAAGRGDEARAAVRELSSTAELALFHRAELAHLARISRRT